MNHQHYVKQFFKNNKMNTFLTILVYMASAGLNIGVSWYLQVIFDLMAGEGTFTFVHLVYLFIAMLILFIMTMAIRYFSYPWFLTRAMQQYKEAAFHDLLKKNLSSFTRESTSTYLSALTNDTLSIEQNYLKTLFQLIQMVVMFVGALALMLYYNVSLSLLAILISAVPLAVSIVTANSLVAKEKEVSNQNESYVAMTKDILNGFPVVKSFKAEDEVQGLYNAQNQQVEAAKRRRERTQIAISGLGEFASILSQIGVMLIGAWMVISNQGGLTAGIVMAFTNLMNFVLQPIAMVPQLMGQRKAAVGLVDKLASHLQANVRDEGVQLSHPIDAAYSVENLGYTYDGVKQALEAVDLTFEAGKAYAIVGGSGSGKSTLIQLMMGTDLTYSGSIRLGGYELKEISTDSLYTVTSLIQQSVFIFDATIVENVTMFKQFPQAEVDRVIQLSGLAALIEARGLDYKCGENGNKLSGGEKQRIAIARSLLKQSQVLFVDEATSALDNQTAHQISQAILDLEDLTRIVITHRLQEDLLRQYDQIIVVKDGRVVELGSFDDLMDDKAYFYSLYTVAN